MYDIIYIYSKDSLNMLHVTDLLSVVDSVIVDLHSEEVRGQTE